MKRSITLCALLLLPLAALGQPLIKPFPFVMPSYDSTRSQWLPTMPVEDISRQGFLRVGPDGHLQWSNGARARFMGASVIQSACFPDSATAIVTAARLRKLGINMLRFNYFDYHNSNTLSTLAPGNRSDTLSPTQMKSLDWFLYQLKRNGIHAHFVLKSRNGPRRDDGVPGWDSAYLNGQYITYISEPFQRMQRSYMTKLFNHVNPYTGLRYADDPVIALLTITDQNSLYDGWIGDRLNQRTNVLAYHHSRLLDTMFASFLRAKYGNTGALKNAYHEGVTTPGPNLMVNPGFESFTDNWLLQVLEGAQASPVIVQGGDVAPGDGPNSLRIVVRKVNGNEGRLYIEQSGMKLQKHHVYRLRFRAKTDSANGRQIRMILIRANAPNDNFGVNETVNITNQWQTFDFTFRAVNGDSLGAILRLYLGREMGDLFLDGFNLQESGREGLLAGEALETSTVLRAKFRDAPKLSLARMYDQVDFYDSLARAYYRTMRGHLKSLGVKALVAGTNNANASADTWVQSEYDFTSETAQWDFNGARSGPYTDSTWVIRNYSVLRYRDQKIPELARNAIAGKPFIAEQYLHIFPNAHRSEMMLFFPAYGSLHDWDGLYLYTYSDRSAEMGDRRRVFKDDFTSIIADPSVTALLPQASAAIRNNWIAPAKRTIRFQHDVADLRYLPVTYSARGIHNIDGAFSAVLNLVNATRADSFNASRHYTIDDYYATVPSDDNIESDTREIKLDMTKGIMELNTPRIQGGAGAINQASSIRTEELGVSWIDGSTNVTYLWSTLDTFALDSSRRSLLTVTTRALNTGAVWQFGDSSLGKNWGTAPMLMESCKLGVNFYTSADSLVLHPLDTLGRLMGRTIAATRSTNSWRVTLDLEEEKTPWFGIEQFFKPAPDTGISAVSGATSMRANAGEIYPNPASGMAMLPLAIPASGARVSARICDLLGRPVATVAAHDVAAGTPVLELDLRDLPNGAYICHVSVGSVPFARKIVVAR